MSFFRTRSKKNDELDVEIESHLSMAERELMQAGASREDARAAARREFGNVSHIKQTTRDMWGGNSVDTLKHDVRYAFRALMKSRGFTSIAVATLAIGIAASTVIFSVADHVVLRPLSYPNADRLFLIEEQIREMKDQYPVIPANASHFLEWQRQCTECETVAAMRQGGLIFTGDGDAEDVGDVRVTWNMLPLLGARTTLGRLFTEDEDNTARGHVVVLTNAYWRRNFGSDRAIVGKSIQLSGTAWQVVGVLSEDFYPPKGAEFSTIEKLPKEIELYTPMSLTEEERNSTGQFDYNIVAKLRPGATLAQVNARLAAIQQTLSARRTDGLTITAQTSSMQSRIVGTARQGLLTLLVAVGAILLIVCVNLTNLLLARQAARSREAALRVALGASQGRLVRGALIESFLVAISGGVLGVLLSRWGLQLLLHFAPANFPRLAEVTLDMRVMAIAALVSILTGLLFGVLPALRYGRVQPASALKAGGRSMTDGRSAFRTRAFLIASQLGLSAALLYSAGLFLASFVRVLDVDKGFTETRALAVDVAVPQLKRAERMAFYDEVLGKLNAVPGARAVGMTTAVPLEGEPTVNPLSRENDQRPMAERPLANISYVAPGYFGALGIVAKRGRLITDADRGRNLVVMSERSAKALWPGEDPIGKRMVPGYDSLSEVVGTVGDLRMSSIESDGNLAVYLPYWASPPAYASLVVSAAGDPSVMTSSVRAVVREVGKTIPVSNVRTVEQVVSTAVASRRFQLLLLLLFASSALVIASIGIYGIISHSLVRRSNEIGVRMALGAERGGIHRMVVWEMFNPVTAGLAGGLTIALGFSFAFRELLFKVQPFEWWIFASVVAALVMVVVAACLIPARKATKGGALLALRPD